MTAVTSCHGHGAVTAGPLRTTEMVQAAAEDAASQLGWPQPAQASTGGSGEGGSEPALQFRTTSVQASRQSEQPLGLCVLPAAAVRRPLRVTVRGLSAPAAARCPSRLSRSQTRNAALPRPLGTRPSCAAASSASSLCGASAAPRRPRTAEAAPRAGAPSPRLRGAAPTGRHAARLQVESSPSCGPALSAPLHPPRAAPSPRPRAREGGRPHWTARRAA